MTPIGLPSIRGQDLSQRGTHRNSGKPKEEMKREQGERADRSMLGTRSLCGSQPPITRSEAELSLPLPAAGTPQAAVQADPGANLALPKSRSCVSLRKILYLSDSVSTLIKHSYISSKLVTSSR